jgi:gamma-glutamyl:cysteine ligase YbdK (ATP-grasp superfamily)
MTARWVIPAFAGYGIELEYAIVDAQSLDVCPIADRLLDALGAQNPGRPQGLLGWCHELASHVVEVRNVLPVPTMHALAPAFQAAIREVNALLAQFSARLLPSGMHPWMDPRNETQLWTRSDPEIYQTYHRLFDCRRHGWANIQSMHINLPFADDVEFSRLHAAIRIVLPLVPALAASSPIADARPTRQLDRRLAVYAGNSSRFPEITGAVIPDTVDTRADYERTVLAPMFQQIATEDPRGVLRFEWLNARGAIARFDRNAIEIRLADTQECPRADIAVAQAITLAVKSLYDEAWSPLPSQRKLPTQRLTQLLDATIREAEEAVIDDCEYLALLGVRRSRCSAGEVWRHVLDRAGRRTTDDGGWHATAAFILKHGTLARRIGRALGGDTSRDRLRRVYAELCECLHHGRMFA